MNSSIIRCAHSLKMSLIICGNYSMLMWKLFRQNKTKQNKSKKLKEGFPHTRVLRICTHTHTTEVWKIRMDEDKVYCLSDMLQVLRKALYKPPWGVTSFDMYGLYSIISYARIVFFFNFYCYSITAVCLLSPSLHPTPGEPTSLPHLHPPPWFCPCVLYSSSGLFTILALFEI